MRSIDPVLSVAGPIGLAAAVKTALVIDMAGGISLGAAEHLPTSPQKAPRLMS